MNRKKHKIIVVIETHDAQSAEELGEIKLYVTDNVIMLPSEY